MFLVESYICINVDGTAGLSGALSPRLLDLVVAGLQKRVRKWFDRCEQDAPLCQRRCGNSPPLGGKSTQRAARISQTASRHCPCVRGSRIKNSA